jgi:hypothetical protein
MALCLEKIKNVKIVLMVQTVETIETIETIEKVHTIEKVKKIRVREYARAQAQGKETRGDKQVHSSPQES